MSSIEPESLRSNKFNDTEGSDTLYDVLNWSILVTEQFRSGGEQYRRKIVEILHCDKFDVETIQNELKGVRSCSGLVLENVSQVLGNKEIMKREGKVEERRSVFERSLYR